MSVLIKGMEMPDNCRACPLETDYGTCGYYSLFVEAGHDSEIWKRRDDCPLIELPPHGRLIDADALAQQYVIAQEQREKDKIDYCNAFMNNGEPCTEWWCVEDMLENAPTIIEAEEGD